MKKTLFILLITLYTGTILFAQSPQSFKYQAVIRDASGAILKNQTVGLQISILQGSSTGATVYTETWTTSTNDFGLVNLNIGEGTSGDNFSTVKWGNDNYWVKVELDENGGTSYTEMGTSKLLSVPYALYSGQTPWTSSGDTLFCVKDAQNRPVFIVFKDGVQVIVDTTAAKSGAGGRFLVSGRGINKNDKGTEMNFMDMTKENYLIGNNVAPNIIPGAIDGIKNSILGYEAGNKLSQGYEHTFIGYHAGYNTVDGNSNVFIGNNAGYSSEYGVGNVNIGDGAGYSNNNNPGSNIFIGKSSGYSNTNGFENVYLGYQAGGAGSNGDHNVYLGSYTGRMNSGSGNVCIGTNVLNTFPNYTNISNKLYIDNENTATPLLWGDFANDSLKVFKYFNINDAYTFPTVDGGAGQVLRTDGNGHLSWEAKSFDNSDKVILLETSVKKQQQQIEELLKENEQIKNENKNLDARIKVLETFINNK